MKLFRTYSVCLLSLSVLLLSLIASGLVHPLRFSTHAADIPPDSAAPAPPARYFSSASVLVKVKPDVKSQIRGFAVNQPSGSGNSRLDTILSKHKAKAMERVVKKDLQDDPDLAAADISLWYKVVLDQPVKKITHKDREARLINQLKSELAADPDIAAVEPDYIVTVDSVSASALPALSATVISPNGGEIWAANTTHTLTWNQSWSTYTYLELIGNNGTVTPIGTLTLAQYVSGTFTYSWTIPASLPAGNYYKLRVRLVDTDTLDHTLSDLSDAPFTITASSGPTITPTPTTPVAGVPNDPYYASSGAWGQAYPDLWGLKKINAVNAWTKSQGQNVIVAVIDTGVDRTHPDLAANMWVNAKEIPNNGIDDDKNGYVDDYYGYDFCTYGKSRDNNPMDDHGHGTHTSGTIAAVANNSTGIAGVAPKAKIMAVKGMGASGNGYISDLAAGLVYAADNGAQVLSNSWGGSGSDQVLTDAVAYAHDIKKAIVVVAAGNDNTDVSGDFPAAYPGAITVASTDHNDAKSDYSNFGLKIDVAAPGGDSRDSSSTHLYENILSLRATGTDLYGGGRNIVGTNYYRARGTSMAAPHVSGVAALIKSLHPAWTNEQVRQALRLGATDILTSGFDTSSGYGRVDAAASLNVAEPLNVYLAAPLSGSVYKTAATVPVTGYAYGTGFTGWTMEYGLLDSSHPVTPAAWATLASSTTAVTSVSSLASWNVSALADGTYVLRLVAKRSAQTYEFRTGITVDQLYITAPVAPDYYTASLYGSTQLPITGTAASANFSYYTVVVTKFGFTAPVTANITLAGGGKTRVRDGLLATWNTAGMSPGNYTIHLQEYVTSGSGYKEKTVTVQVDPTLHPGWPLTITRDYGVWGGSQNTTAADINGDAKAELVFKYSKLVHAFNDQGKELAGWPVSMTDYGGGETSRAPAVGDIDGDGKMEIVANAAGDVGFFQAGSRILYVWRSSGSLYPGFPKTLSGYTFDAAAPVILTDMDKNGTQDIVLFSNISSSGSVESGWVTSVQVLDYHGNFLSGWSDVRISGLAHLGYAEMTEMGPGFYNTDTRAPSVADFDRDGQKEIALLSPARQGPYTVNSRIIIVKKNGAILSGWPKAATGTTGQFTTSPVFADLNRDGNIQLVVGTSTNQVYVYNPNGSVAAGWPRQIDTYNGAYNVDAIAVGDMDGDKKLEIAASTDTGYDSISAWKANGLALSNWPVSYPLSGYPRPPWSFGAGTNSLAIADIDGDGQGEVLAENSDNPSLIAYKASGQVAAGFPKPINDFTRNVPAVADFDGDGLSEAIAIQEETNIILMYDLPGKAVSQALQWPMLAYDSQHSSANIIPTNYPTLTPTITPTPTPPCPVVVTKSALSAINPPALFIDYRNASAVAPVSLTSVRLDWPTDPAAALCQAQFTAGIPGNTCDAATCLWKPSTGGCPGVPPAYTISAATPVWTAARTVIQAGQTNRLNLTFNHSLPATTNGTYLLTATFSNKCVLKTGF